MFLYIQIHLFREVKIKTTYSLFLLKKNHKQYFLLLISLFLEHELDHSCSPPSSPCLQQHKLIIKVIKDHKSAVYKGLKIESDEMSDWIKKFLDPYK